MGIPENWLWRTEEVSPRQAVVFDIDGVICNADARQHFLERPKRDWEGFFAACGDDEAIEETVRLINVIAPDVAIVLLTGRPLGVQALTVDWLERHRTRWDLLIMREAGNYSASLSFKRQTVRKLRAVGFELILAFEDDPRNEEMFEEEGVPCMYIHSGYTERRDAERRQA